MDDQLPMVLEQFEQADFALGAAEDVVFRHLDHGESAAICVHSILLAGQFFFFGQKLFAFDKPLVMGSDRRMRNLVCFGVHDSIHILTLKLQRASDCPLLQGLITDRIGTSSFDNSLVRKIRESFSSRKHASRLLLRRGPS